MLRGGFCSSSRWWGTENTALGPPHQQIAESLESVGTLLLQASDKFGSSKTRASSPGTPFFLVGPWRCSGGRLQQTSTTSAPASPTQMECRAMFFTPSWSFHRDPSFSTSTRSGSRPTQPGGAGVQGEESGRHRRHPQVAPSQGRASRPCQHPLAFTLGSTYAPPDSTQAPPAATNSPPTHPPTHLLSSAPGRR